jgi:hypothetical protein
MRWIDPSGFVEYSTNGDVMTFGNDEGLTVYAQAPLDAPLGHDPAIAQAQGPELTIVPSLALTYDNGTTASAADFAPSGETTERGPLDPGFYGADYFAIDISAGRTPTREGYVRPPQVNVARMLPHMIPGVNFVLTVTDPNATKLDVEIAMATDVFTVATIGFGGVIAEMNAARGVAAQPAGETISLFRAVSPAEFEDIVATGSFRAAPGGGSMAAKQFGLSFEETLQFANRTPDAAAIIRAEIPMSTFQQLEFSRTIDPFIFRSGVITAQPGAQQQLLNQSIIMLEHAF